jgi:hypothetical protein
MPVPTEDAGGRPAERRGASEDRPRAKAADKGWTGEEGVRAAPARAGAANEPPMTGGKARAERESVRPAYGEVSNRPVPRAGIETRPGWAPVSNLATAPVRSPAITPAVCPEGPAGERATDERCGRSTS